MSNSLSQASKGDVVLLHGSCHNPSGADLNRDQWRAVLSQCQKQALVPFIDLAYQGFADDLETDAFGARLAAEMFDEVLLAVSCSKTFGLYRERVGLAMVLSDSAQSAQAINSQLANIARGIYSMPPSHGASVVATILGCDDLRGQWQQELTDMRSRIQQMRRELNQGLRSELANTRFDFIEHQKGMFSFLGLTQQQVSKLAESSSVYMLDSSRINLAGLNTHNISHFVQALGAMLRC